MGLTSRGQETRNNALSCTKLGRKADPCQKKLLGKEWGMHTPAKSERKRESRAVLFSALPLVSPTQHVPKKRKKKPACSFFHGSVISSCSYFKPLRVIPRISRYRFVPWQQRHFGPGGERQRRRRRKAPSYSHLRERERVVGGASFIVEEDSPPVT